MSEGNFSMVVIPKDFTNSPLDREFARVLCQPSIEASPTEDSSSSRPENQAQLVLFSRVITALLLLTGAGIMEPGWALAQHSGGDFVETPAIEAAPPADVGGHEGFVFFPRAAVEETAADSFSAVEPVSDQEAEASDSLSSADFEEQASGASKSFSRRGSSRTIPVQYPLDDSVYEGEDPVGKDPDQDESKGSWHDSSVDRPDEEMPLEDQPWVEWHKVSLLSQTIPGDGSNGLGITSFDLRGTLKFARFPVLFVTPRAGLHFLNGPSSTDLPARLYDFSVEADLYVPVNDRWTLNFAAAPSVFSDLQATQNAFRMVGRGMAFYRWSPQLQLAGGFVYLGRKDIAALPAAGFIYTPSDDMKYDIMFPKPRISYRYHHTSERERWVYASGELGGGSWAVRRTSGVDDVASYRDFQLLLGIEQKQTKALNWQFEGGFVFGRKLKYLSKLGDTSLPTATVLRVVLSY